MQLGITPSNTEDDTADYLLATPIEQYQGDQAETAGDGGALHAGRASRPSRPLRFGGGC